MRSPEANPPGQYMGIEYATDLGITAARADAVIAPC
jgi:hypothetical protein